MGIDRPANGLLIGCLLVACGGGSEPPPPSRGAVVVTVAVGGAGDLAGLEPEDRIVGWSRNAESAAQPTARIRIESPVDLYRVEVTEAPLGALWLEVLRGRDRLELRLDPAEWMIEVRPALTAELSDRHREAAASVRSERTDAGFRIWEALREQLLADDRRHAALWVASEAALILEEAGEASLAGELHEEALRRAESDGMASAWLLERRAESLPPAEASLAYEEALERFATAEVHRARLLYRLAVRAFRQGQLMMVEQRAGEARALWSRAVPGGDGEIESAILLAKVPRNRGQLDVAADRLEALASEVARHRSGSRLQATVLSELGVVNWGRGELRRAENELRESLAIYDRLGVRDRAYAYTRMGIGIVVSHRGNLGQAREHFRQALAVFEVEASGTVFEAWSLQQLGVMDHELGNYDAAATMLGRALAVFRSVPSPGDVGTTLGNLGRLAQSRNNDEEASRLYREALEVLEAHDTAAEEVARIRGDLAEIWIAAGEPERARRLLDDALAWYAAQAPGSLSESQSLIQRGRLALLEGDERDAAALYRRAVRIRRRLAPGSAREAEALHALGSLRREQGRIGEARALLEEAVAALEAQKGRLGAGWREDTGAFAARHAPIYRELIELLLELELPAEAFEVLERYRAQGLLALMAARDLLLDADVPAGLKARRRELARIYDRMQGRLAALDDRAPAGEVEDLLVRLRGLRRRRAELNAELLRESPRLAYLTSPRPLTTVEAAAALDPGTLLLSYAVLSDETYLFVLSGHDAGGLEAVPLGIDEPTLRREIQALLDLVRSPAVSAAKPGLRRRSRALYRRLLGPAEARIDRARRLLIVPDGPLHTLPFGALADASTETGGYLLARKPLHTAVSVTVYSQLSASSSRSAPGRPEVLAFGDPLYARGALPRPAAGAAALAPMTLRGRVLEPLPKSRAEVEAIGRLFPAAEVYVGRDATEETFKRKIRDARYLHLACHGAVDDRFPLDSYLALAAVDAARRPDGRGENGFLQAWEIFELRLDADLVTLSACETGLGRELGGEGLIGLTRAFQYAGARSVVASLWTVSDRSTGALMERFYGYLKSGLAKDEALRSAQLDLLYRRISIGAARDRTRRWFAPLRALFGPLPADPIDVSHPFYWAAFGLYGAAHSTATDRASE